MQGPHGERGPAPAEPEQASPAAASTAPRWAKGLALFFASLALAWPIARWQLGARQAVNGSTAPIRAVDTANLPPIQSRSSGQDTATGSLPAIIEATAESEAEPASSTHHDETAPPTSPVTQTTDATSCVHALVPEGTFGVDKPLDWICGQSDLWSLELDLHGRVLRKRNEGGSALWLRMGRYAFAAIAVLRSSCCTNPSPLVVNVRSKYCPRLEDSLADLARSQTPDAIDTYGETIQCWMDRQVRLPEAWYRSTDPPARAAFEQFFGLNRKRR